MASSIRLLYTSDPDFDINDRDGMNVFTQIINHAFRRNRERKVMGALVVAPNAIIHCLEGQRDAVSQTFFQIESDARHGNVALQDVAPTLSPQFRNFVVAIAGKEQIAKTTAPTRNGAELDLGHMSPKNHMSFIKEVIAFDQRVFREPQDLIPLAQPQKAAANPFRTS